MMFVEFLLLFTLFVHNFLRNNFDGTVGAIYLANIAGSAFVLVVFVVWHGNFTLKTIEHLQRFPVFGILLRNDGAGAGKKVFPGYSHAFQQRNYAVEHAGKVID